MGRLRQTARLASSSASATSSALSSTEKSSVMVSAPHVEAHVLPAKKPVHRAGKDVLAGVPCMRGKRTAQSTSPCISLPASSGEGRM